MSEEMVLGKRYQLPHGSGIYIGYEAFDEKGMSLPIVEKPISDSNNRRVFKLDPGNSWPFKGNYYAWSKDVEPYVDV